MVRCAKWAVGGCIAGDGSDAGWTSGRTQRRLTGSGRSNDVGLQELTPAPHLPHTAGVAAAGARQQLLQDDRGWDTGPRTRHTNTGSSSRRLQQFGPIYAEVPGDLTGLASILAAARDAFAFFEPDMFPPPVRQQRTPRSRALGGSGNTNTAQQGDFSLLIAFKSANPDADVALRLPGPPRSFNVTAIYMAGPGPQQPCTHARVPYAAQELTCGGMSPGSKWQVSLVDAGASYRTQAARVQPTRPTYCPERQRTAVSHGRLCTVQPCFQLCFQCLAR